MLDDKLFPTKLLSVCLPYYGGLKIIVFTSDIVCFYIFIHARKSGKDTVKRTQKSR